MKVRYILPFLALALGLGTQAQGPVSLTDADGTEVNEQTLFLTAELSENPMLTLEQTLIARNNTDVPRNINVKRYETSVLSSTQNYFCWTLCYPPEQAGDRDLWVAHEAVNMGSDEEFDGFAAYYVPMGVPGTSTFLYVWYDMDSPNDSTWVEIVFEITEAVGVAEIELVQGFTAFPNPSLGGDITFDYQLASITPDMQLTLYNMLGERQSVRALDGVEGRIVLNDHELANGVWFAVLERNGKALATKRVVVAR